MLVSPAATPVTIPAAFTVAIDLSDVVHVTYWSVVSTGVNTFSSLNVSPI